jgi:hypothetical protein
MEKFKKIEIDFPYPLRTNVFVVTDKDKIEEREVRSYETEIGLYADKYIGNVKRMTLFQAVHIGDYFEKPGLVFEVDIDSVFGTEEEAKKASGFKEVFFNEDVWFKALGKRDQINKNVDGEILKFVKEEEYPIEDSELGVCCASISEVRSLLYKAYNNDGLIGRDINYLRNQYQYCMVDLDEAPNLKKILDAFGVKDESGEIE